MIELEHPCDLHVELAEPLEIGDSPRGRRRIIPIVGGSAKGERLARTILPGGADTGRPSWPTAPRSSTRATPYRRRTAP